MSTHRQGMIPWCSFFVLSVLLTGIASAQGTGGRLVFTVQPSAAAAEATIRPAIQVTVQDSAGQTATSFAGVVTLAITDETGGDESELAGTTNRGPLEPLYVRKTDAEIARESIVGPST